jgi:UDP-GlcNAc:undecaprenyl-phosphate/decaprenyl-phosphate GlcNAc-1-phosphate transferase
MGMQYLVAFVASLLLSAVITRQVRRLAIARGWLIAAGGERHIHKSPVPRLGGVAILFTIVLIVAGWSVVCRVRHVYFPQRQVGALLGPTLLIFIVGLIDDFRSLSPTTKFGAQAIAAVWLFYDGFNITRFQLFFQDRPLSGDLSLLLTIFWILLVTNAFNLLDGLDGLAAGSALFSTIVVFIASWTAGNNLTTVTTVVLAGAVAGFLRYNFNPATIFLGDCGSLVTGFLLGAVSIAGSQKASATVAIGIPVLSFGLPLLDTGFAVLRRLLNRRPLFSADGDHIHHKLLQRGFSPRQAVIVLYGISAIFGFLSLLLLSRTAGLVPLVLAIVGIGIFFGLQHLGYHEVYELRRLARRTWEQKSAISNNLAIWHAIDRLASARTTLDVSRILQAALENNGFSGFGFAFTPDLPRPDVHLKPLTLRGVWQGGTRQMAPGWTARFDLVRENGQVAGHFVVTRGYDEQPFEKTFDCLTIDFISALSTTLQRIGENLSCAKKRTASQGAGHSQVLEVA